MSKMTKSWTALQSLTIIPVPLLVHKVTVVIVFAQNVVLILHSSLMKIIALTQTILHNDGSKD